MKLMTINYKLTILLLVTIFQTCGAIAADTIPQTSWNLLYVDSEETVGEDGAATNSFDGDTNTFWHTQWYGSPDPSHPHEIQIDLGAEYNISGFQYVPRQDGGINGTISQYKFYISTDGISWNSAVASGTFSNDTTQKEVTFSTTSGRYVRFVSLSEVNGGPWACASEINVLGTLTTNNPPSGVIDTPTEDITVSSGNTVNFTATASDPDGDLSISHLWNFGDPTIADATTEDPGDIQFDNTGVFTVTYTATDSLGLADPTPDTRTITVIDSGQAPDGTIDTPTGDVTVNVGDSVVFEGTGTDPDGDLPLSHLWNFGDSGVANASVEDPGSIQFDIPGTFTVTYTVTDNLGFVDPTPDTRTITVLGSTIPQTSWNLLYVDSEETVGEDGAATNSFDGDTNTFWHTQWYGSPDPSHPHEIQIDLGAEYNISGFQYVPRQDGGINGTISQYKFYISTDGISWNSAVASGTFSNDTTQKEVTFSTTSGRYVRFVSLSEVNGGPWACASEINVLGTLTTNNPPSGVIDTPTEDITVSSGNTVNFTATASDPDGDLSISHLWNFGDPTIADATTEDPGDIQFDNTGVFTVTYTATDSLGLADPTPDTRTITVIDSGQAPDGTIDTPTGDITVIVGDSVVFEGTGTDPDGDLPLSHLWNFGDSGVANASVEDPGSIQFDIPGTFTVTYTVTDNLGFVDPTPDTRTITVLGSTIPQTSWNLLYVDSEETVGEDGAATNSFDGDTNTFWHTQWYGSPDPSHPHEIQIDLGAEYNISGFQYVPRQDGGINGTISQYKFYISTDGISWNSAVASGTFSNDTTQKEVTFSTTSGRYVRFVSLSEVNGGPWACASEINVLGTLTTNNPPSGVIDTPTEDITVSSGNTVNFTATASDPDGDLSISHLWNFGDPTIADATTEDPGDIQFDNTGVFTVTYTATDSLGLADPTPDTRTITVIDSGQAPDGTIDTPTGDVTVNVGDSVVFEGTGTDPDGDLPLSHLWNFGDSGVANASVEDPGSIQFDIPGTFTVTYTVTDNLGFVDPTPDTVVITVNAFPDSIIDTPATDITITTGSAIDFYGTGTDPDVNLPLTFLWDFMDSEIPNSTLEDPSGIQFNSKGIYTVTFTVTDAIGLSDPTPATRIVTVGEEPNGTIDTPTGDVTINAGDSVFFEATATDPDGDLPLSHLWDFGNSGIANITVEDPGLIQFDTPGIFNITYTVTDSISLVDPTPSTVTVTVQGDTLPQTGWTLLYVDSEETVGEDGAGENAFDDDINTKWHTEWYSSDPVHPHEIQIDLGNFYEIFAFRYLSGQENGRVANYEFYVSTDGVNWGEPVVSGSLPNDSSEQEISFPSVACRYIRFVALSEVNTNPWTVMSEFNLLGYSFSGNFAPNGTILSPSNNIAINTGDIVEFSGSGSDTDNNLPLSHLWQFGDDSGIDDANIESPGFVQFNTPGTYVVTYTVTDSLGASDSSPASRIIKVTDIGSDTTISQSNLAITYVDSEETLGEDGSAINAIDGDASTFWHTEWYYADPSPPHEIRFDLGSAFEIDAFRYLPRQDGTNGRVGSFQIFTSADGVIWGSSVAQGTFDNDFLEKQVLFAPTIAQFIKFVALDEVNDNPWTTAAEINIEGKCDTPYVKLLSPTDYYIQPSADPNLTVTASVCLNETLFPGWSIKFQVDGGIGFGGLEQVVGAPPYEATFTGLSLSEHTVEAFVIDDLGVPYGEPSSSDFAYPVGVGRYFVAIGDSITVGVGDDDDSDDDSLDGRNIGGGFTPILNDRFTQDKGYPHTVVMAGIAGHTSVQGLERLPTVLENNPNSQYFLILYGTNDAGALFPIPSGYNLDPEDSGYPGSFKENIQQMIDLITNAGKSAFLAKIPYSLDTDRNSTIEDYNLVIQELWSENGIGGTPPDFYAHFSQVENQDQFADLLHPNGVGYQNMAELWFNALPTLP